MSFHFPNTYLPILEIFSFSLVAIFLNQFDVNVGPMKKKKKRKTLIGKKKKKPKKAILNA